MSDQKKAAGEKIIASNPNRGHYFLEENVEAGLVLLGTEIKSMRKQSPNMRDSFVEVVAHKANFEAYICNLHIGPYSHGNIQNHEPMRKRKLLLHRHQLKKLYGAVIQKGMTIVPLKIYFKSSIVKVEIALGKGKKLHDKRNTIRQKSVDREISRAMKRER